MVCGSSYQFFSLVVVFFLVFVTVAIFMTGVCLIGHVVVVSVVLGVALGVSVPEVSLFSLSWMLFLFYLNFTGVCLI